MNISPPRSNVPTHIMLIEDNPDDAFFAQEMLSEVGIFQCQIVDRLSLAIDHLLEGSFDLVLLDLSLPDSEGLNGLTKLHSQVPQIPIVVLTGREDETLGMRALRQGAQDYIIKGQVSGSLLKKSIHYAIERGHYEAKARELIETKALVTLLTNFIQDVSHEFRTPLAIIQAKAYLLIKTNDLEQRADHAKVINSQVDRLVKILEQMLIIVELDSIKALPKSLISLTSVIADTIKAIAPLVSSKHLVVKEIFDLSVDKLQAHQGELSRALFNIAENAAIYTPDGGTITFYTYNEGDSAIIEVIDTGSGISSKDMVHIFEHLYRADKARSVKSNGAGLGLSIAKRILELHGGNIEVQSILGQGSTFRMILPHSFHTDRSYAVGKRG